MAAPAIKAAGAWTTAKPTNPAANNAGGKARPRAIKP